MSVGNVSVTTTPVTASGITLSNTATVTSGVTDPDSSNNSVMESTTVNPAADLALTKSSLGRVLLNEQMTYTITVTNNGLNAATGVVVTDTLPTDMTFVCQQRGRRDG